MEIRNYQVSDFLQVKEILQRGNLYREHSDNEKALERKIQQSPDSIIAAVEDSRVVGTLFIVEDFIPLMFRLSVHPDYRNRGIGKALMQRGEEVLRKKGYNRVNILVAADDTELQSYYEKQGYEKGNKFVWMVKEF